MRKLAGLRRTGGTWGVLRIQSGNGHGQRDKQAGCSWFLDQPSEQHPERCDTSYVIRQLYQLVDLMSPAT